MEQWSFDDFCQDQFDQLQQQVAALEARDEIRKLRLTHIRTIIYYCEESLDFNIS